MSRDTVGGCLGRLLHFGVFLVVPLGFAVHPIGNGGTVLATVNGLAIRDIEDKRARERAKQAGRPKNQRTDSAKKLVEGTTVQGWNAAYGALSLAFPGRLDPRL
jgi:hypothetical protein